MKFSHKLFKIHAKMSLPVFILMGSICHLGATESDDFHERILASTSNSGTPVQDKDGKRLSVSSDASLTPLHDSSIRYISNMPADEDRAADMSRAVFLAKNRADKQKNRTKKEDGLSSGGLEEALKSSPNRFKMFAGNDMHERFCRRAEANRLKAAEKSSQSSSGQAPVLPQDTGTPEVRFGDAYNTHLERGYKSPGEIGENLNPMAGLNAKETQFHELPKGSYGNGDNVVVEGGVERVLFSSDLQQAEASIPLNQGTMVLHGRCLDGGFGDSVTNIFDTKSILTAANEDEFTLGVSGKEVSTSFKDMLATVDVSKANDYFTYLGYFVDGMELDTEEQKDYCNDLLNDASDMFPEQTVETVWPYLEQKMKEAVDYLPGFQTSLLKKDKIKKACIEKSRKEAQTVSVLKDEYGSLVQILSGIAADSMFADSEELAPFKAGHHWTAATISQGFKFLAAQCIQFHRTQFMLTQNVSQLTLNNTELTVELRRISDRESRFLTMAETNSQTIDRLIKERSELEGRLQSLVEERDTWLNERAATQQLRKREKKLIDELTRLKGKSYVYSVLKSLN